jgi:hypothetical protein
LKSTRKPRKAGLSEFFTADTRIVAGQEQKGGLEGAPGGSPAQGAVTVKELGDTYLERVAKYVPAEIVAFYIFSNTILKQSLQAPGTMAGYSVHSIGVIVFYLAWVFTPLYIWRVSKPEDAWKLNALMATLLFPIWAYAVEGVGPTTFFPFDGHLAAIILGAGSLVSGLVAPGVESTNTLAGQAAI